MKTIIQAFTLFFLVSLSSTAVLSKKETKIIKTGDILHIQTPYNEGHAPAQRDKLYIVNKDNQIDLGKGLGITSTKNLSTEGLVKHIRQSIDIKNPSPEIKVTILTQKANGKNVQMLGHLNKPSTLNFKKGLTLKQAIKQCEGATAFAAINRIQLIRNNKITQHDLRKQTTKNMPLQPGDILNFPQVRWIGK